MKAISIFYLLLFYITIQLVWWGNLLIRLQKTSKSMVIGEGLVFLGLLGIGTYYLQRAIKREEAHERIKRLKEQQDGDYYLTSLLSNPLSKNNNDSVIIKTECYLQQHKNFQFMDWKTSLGGDLCLTERIVLANGKNYTVYLNADAMGKSLQGAAGSLLLGSAVHSILLKDKKEGFKAFSPTDWLTETYSSIRDFFMIFGGAMLVSLTLGIIEEETGECFFWNAEHPFQILYRNREVSYIENSVTMNKIGFDAESDLTIQRITLLPGDVVILGSDGKDDLNLAPHHRKKQINEDPDFFLKITKDASGNIKNIMEKIFSIGEPTDDLSIIRIEYCP